MPQLKRFFSLFYRIRAYLSTNRWSRFALPNLILLVILLAVIIHPNGWPGWPWPPK